VREEKQRKKEPPRTGKENDVQIALKCEETLLNNEYFNVKRECKEINRI
jgi:hypothetical protein